MPSKERKVIGGLSGVLLVLIVGVFSLSVADHYLLRSGSLAAVVSVVLVDLTNGDRYAEALSTLVPSTVLTAAAQAKADDMASKSYFAHTSPDGRNSWYWFKQAGYPFLYAGENLAVDFSDSNDVEKAWMNSPTHRANILNEHFTQVGIATAEGVYQGRPTTFVVQMFGTPAESSAPTRVASETVPTEPSAPAVATAQTEPAKQVSVSAKAAPPAPTILGTEADSITPAPASWWQRLIASPKTMLQYAYEALALILLVLLAYVTELEFHKRHMRHVVAAAFFFITMAGLIVVADVVFFSSPVLAGL